MKYQLTVDGKIYSIDKRIDGFYLNESKLIDNNALKNLSSDFEIITVENELHIWLDGQDYFISFEKESENSSQLNDKSGNIVSPLNGVINQVNVSLGSKVKKGDPLLTIEAMKMLYPLYASCDGTVVAFDVKVGQSVKSKQVVVKIESN